MSLKGKALRQQRGRRGEGALVTLFQEKPANKKGREGEGDSPFLMRKRAGGRGKRKKDYGQVRNQKKANAGGELEGGEKTQKRA